jgi:hypothetical protein
MQTQRPRRRWTDEVFESEIRNVASALGRFPTVSELAAMKRRDLSSEITRRGGFTRCAQAFGLTRIESDSDTGWEGERAAAQRLTELGFQVAVPGAVKCPFDMLIDQVLRVDVKSARLCRYQHSVGWFYRIAKYPQADLILLWQLDEAGYYALPWYVCPRTNITISRDGGKYAAFRNNDRVIREMVELRRGELQNSESRLPEKAA